MMILIMLFIPLMGLINISTMEENSNSSMKSNKIKMKGLKFTIAMFFYSIILWLMYDSNNFDYQFTFDSINYSQFSGFSLGIDGISMPFIMLTTFIFPIAILSNWNNLKMANKTFILNILLLEFFLLILFSVRNLIMFYIFFEAVLMPLFFMIGIWGGSILSIRAAFLLFLYTLFGSLFMLLAIIMIYNLSGSIDFNYLNNFEFNFESQNILWIAFFISFSIKTPLVPFHIWLPSAHAEAPIAGSIILAGIILKLATYGYLSILINFMPDSSYYYSPLIQTMAFISLLYSSLATISQTDFKALIAYSSISHMAIIILGLFSNKIQGIDGSIILSLAHGLVSPALFILVGAILYDSFHTSTIRYYRGMTQMMPIFSIMYFIFTIFNSAVPLSANWLGEFLCFIGIFEFNPILAIMSSICIVLSAIYSIWVFNRMSFGQWSMFINYTTDLNSREIMMLLPILMITIMLGIYPNEILMMIHSSTSNLIYNLQI